MVWLTLRLGIDLFGAAGYKVFALTYPAVPGVISATISDVLFRRGDLP